MLKGNEYPSPEIGAMDMTSELANQAAAEAAVAAAITEASAASESNGDETLPARPVPHENGLDVPAAISSLPSSSTSSSLSGTAISRPAPDSSAVPAFQRLRATPAPFQFGAPHRQAPDSPLTNSQQLAVLREAYARNPNPGKKELEVLAEKTGRPWAKIREYFRQRRSKLRGLADLETMEEPGRASGWLQVTYRPGPSTAVVSQLALYNAYKVRFDPYATMSPLLAGQELIQLACATYPGCEMARDDGDYVLRGLKEKDAPAPENEWDRSVDALVEPLRGTTWLLSNYQHQSDSSMSPSVPQTEIYSAYAARFSTLLSDVDHPGAEMDADAEAELKEFEANMAADDPEVDDINTFLPPAPDDGTPHVDTHNQAPHEEETEAEAADGGLPARENRLLNPVELITLVKMTFPKSEAIVDDGGRFVIRGLERRDAVEKGRSSVRAADMFPFALASHPSPSDPSHPFTSLLKRKLQLLTPEPGPEPEPKRRATSIGVNIPPMSMGASPIVEEELGSEDLELIQGLTRFRNSRLGREVRDICVQQ